MRFKRGAFTTSLKGKNAVRLLCCLPFKEFYTKQAEKSIYPRKKQAKIVAFTHAMVQLELHKI